ncbi:MAG: hypothetical protein M1829_001466 [Trizodia sp. TS-e1964]|nr:MAG: hypothetical protein M1829_001466 [Trizodia sp. TS-e1964]
MATHLRLPWPPLLSRLTDNLLARHSPIAGITTPYIYISPSARGSIFGLHNEDFNLYSLNLHHAGQTKYWVMIPRGQKAALFRLLAPLCLQLFEPEFCDAICDQWIRYLSIFVPTAVLSQAGIAFTTVEQHPGDLIITDTKTFHQGCNAGANLAEAINFASPESQGFAHGYRSCTDTCRLALRGEEQLSLDHFAYYNLAANADAPIIIDFQSMQKPPIDDTHAAFRARRLFPIQQSQSPAMNRYLSNAEVPRGARDLKVRFVNDVGRVFADADEPQGLLQESSFANLLAISDTQARWPAVPMQKRARAAVTIASPEDLDALDPCDAAASLYMARLDPAHLNFPTFLPINTANVKPFRYEYRRQGPPWGIWKPGRNEQPDRCLAAMSCALDACIVAAMFLNLGRLKADTTIAAPATRPIGTFQKLLLALIGTDWHVLQPAEAACAKDRLYQLVLAKRREDMLIAGFNEERDEDIMLPASGPQGIWLRCTAGLGQFTFSGETIRRCPSCEHSQLANLLEPVFSTSETRRVLSSELPVRMTVTPNGFFAKQAGPVRRVAEHFVLSYFIQGHATARRAEYRWIGGI